MSNKAPEDHRRKWNVEEMEEKARKRELEGSDSDEEDKPKVRREMLKARDYKVDLDSKLGKSIVVTKATPSNSAGGYYCNVCDCVVKDSINFLDHINGKKHQRNLGMSMKVERSTVDQVKERFKLNKQKLEEKKKQYDFEERMKELKEEEEKTKAFKKEKKKEMKKQRTKEPECEASDDMAAIMGFSGFGGSVTK